MSEHNENLEALAQRLDQRRRLDKRLRLLEAIASTGSLSAAADLIGISYKTAWNHVRELHQQSGEQLVETGTGGASGGYSRLTERGELLASLLRLQRQRSRQQLAERLPSLRFSARNQLPGRISHLDSDGVIARVDLRVSGIALRCHITGSSIDRLGLGPGSGVFAIIKASSVNLAPPESEGPAGSVNRIPAVVQRCTRSDRGYEIELLLADRVPFVVARTLDAREERWLSSGARVQVLIQPEEIMLATTARI